MFFNILTANHKDSLCRRENLHQSIQIQLSEEQKILSQFFAPFVKFISNFAYYSSENSGSWGKHLTNLLLWATAKPLFTCFTVLSIQWMKERRTWGWSSLVWIKPVVRDNKPRCEWRISCVLYRLQSPSWGRLKCQQGGASWAR